jgi:SARP family transcriptional regulator, regulator of embCAB operon
MGGSVSASHERCACWQAPKLIRLTLLGGFETSCAGTVVPLPLGAQRLLAFLAAHASPLMRTYVAEALWPDGRQRRASANLRSVVWRIRQTDHNLLVSSGGSRLSLAKGIAVDLHQRAASARLLLDRSAAWTVGDFHRELTAGLSTELLCDWYDEWVLLEQDRWNQLRFHALEALAERLLDAGELSCAVEAALAAVRAEPLRESAHRVLIRVYAAEGNWCEAMAQYKRYRHLVRRELNTPPTEQMEELIRVLMPR